MNLVESTIRFAIPALGVGSRWLREELRARAVSVRLTEACLKELLLDAYKAAKRQAADIGSSKSYRSCLRQQIDTRAEFLRVWTLSDDEIDADGPYSNDLVRLARKYALPRPWRLSEPVASESLRRTPTYGHWANAI
jgi:hypothetical protein